ncbi:MAG: hypothetical protein ACK41P_02740 [Asticcacaulis sp.]
MSNRSFLPFIWAAFLSFMASPGLAAGPCEGPSCPSSWTELDSEAQKGVFRLAEDYKAFMAVARTAETTIAETIKRANAQGFRAYKPGQTLSPGQKLYDVNRDGAMTLFVVGKRPIADGVRLSASHLDSPHLTLKARPIYDGEGFALFQTNFHGGILPYQWGNTPLALIGKVVRKDGHRVDINVGLKPDDPVFIIAGLSPHVDIDLRERKNRDVLQPEELDPIIASMPQNASKSMKEQVTAYLKQTYDISADDLVSAELSLVPAMAPRDVGFDRAMMTMYGQDDRFAVFASIKSLFDLPTPEHTTVVFLANNEEVGNVNNTGAVSSYATDIIREMLFSQLGQNAHEVHFQRTLKASKVLSTDVNDGINPIWPGAWEKGNAPRVGHGINIKVYGQGKNATPEYAAWLRQALDSQGVRWQTATYKVGRAGGGTLGGEFSRRDMDVIDIGAPVLSIHNIYETSSKVDLWWLYKANTAFFTVR